MGLFLLEAVSALCAAEFSIRFLCNKHLVTVLAQLHGMVFVRQQEAEHHMNPQHERMEIPYNRRLFIKCNMVCGRIAAEGSHTHLHGVALPIELGKDQWTALLTEYIQSNFVAEDMCADVAIHDTDGHNPHAHIMLTVRPLDEQSKWQYKTEKEYLCVRNGEERGFTAAEFKAAQADGWEKQYQYKIGKKKVYMAPSAAEAQGLVRASKHPKSTKYGRQNPIAEKWNSDEQLVLWRKAWADITNTHLERAGADARIDHRSHAERGLDEQPTIHEGVIARASEKKGIIADRCEINRQIKADNALLRELKATVKKLMQATKNTLPGMAEKLETLRQNMIIFRYQLLHIAAGKSKMNKRLNVLRPELERYLRLAKQIKEKTKQRNLLLDERKAVPVWNLAKRQELAKQIATLAEDIEELRSEKAMLLHSLD